MVCSDGTRRDAILTLLCSCQRRWCELLQVPVVSYLLHDNAIQSQLQRRECMSMGTTKAHLTLLHLATIRAGRSEHTTVTAQETTWRSQEPERRKLGGEWLNSGFRSQPRPMKRRGRRRNSPSRQVALNELSGAIGGARTE